MIESRHTSVLSIDGGGTRCRIAMQKGDAITSVETGSANISTDYAGAVREVLNGLTALSVKTTLRRAELASLPAFIGLAGVTGPEIARRLRAALPFTNVRIEDDRPAALRGALGNRDGVIAHCGTGSFYGAQYEGAMTFSGGWGPVLGDEASAQWVGRTALKVTLEAVDRRRNHSEMTSALLKQFGGPTGIVGFGKSASPTQFGAVAPMVTDHAAKGDALALHVMSAGASEIARSLTQIGWTNEYVICLTGGIGPYFGPYLPAAMRAKVAEADGEPLSGALSLARELEKETRT